MTQETKEAQALNFFDVGQKITITDTSSTISGTLRELHIRRDPSRTPSVKITATIVGYGWSVELSPSPRTSVEISSK